MINDEGVRPGDTYANDQPTWIPQYPDSHPTTLVDYDLLEQWLSQHLPPPDQLEVLVIFTDTRPLHQVGAWKYTKRLWQHRFSKRGPHGERWQGLFVPLTDEAGLSEVQCTWGGVFVAEAISALRPAWHLLLSDTDVAPTALFEIHELLDLCRHITHEALVGGEPGLLVGTEPHQDINAGMAIFPGTEDSPKPGTLRRKVMTARRMLLEKPRVDLPAHTACLSAPGHPIRATISSSSKCGQACTTPADGSTHTHSIGRDQGWKLQGLLGGVGHLRNLDMHYGLAYTK